MNCESPESLLDTFCNELSSVDENSKHDSFDSITFRNNMNSQDLHGGSMSRRSSHSDEIAEYDLKKNKTSVKHREMPVDVPESFVEFIKVPPRYPPAQYLSSRSSLSSQNNSRNIAKGSLTTTFNSPSSSSAPTHVPLLKEVIKTRISLSSFDLVHENQKPQPQVAVIRIKNDEVLSHNTLLFIYVSFNG